MKSKRAYIDYSLDKRATLLGLFRGVVDACDADPYLMRAAKYHGEKVDRNCPVCKKASLVPPRSFLKWRKSLVSSPSISLKSAESVLGTIYALPIY